MLTAKPAIFVCNVDEDLAAGEQDNDYTPTTVSVGGGSNCNPDCQFISVSHLMNKRSQSNGLGCQVCAFEGRSYGIVKTTVVCLNHRIRLCTKPQKVKNDIKGSDGNIITNYSWRAPNQHTSCWRKAHDYYIPNGLFRDEVDPVQQHEIDMKKVRFQCCIISSDLYKKKNQTLGIAYHARGRKKRKNSSPTNNQQKKKKKNKNKPPAKSILVPDRQFDSPSRNTRSRKQQDSDSDEFFDAHFVAC